MNQHPWPLPWQRYARPLPQPWKHALFVFIAALLLLGSGSLLLCRPAAVEAAVQPMEKASSETFSAVLPDCITTVLPSGAATHAMVYPEARLLAGRMMLIDESHPFPDDAAPPNTFNLLAASHGSIACRDTQATLQPDALAALQQLFHAARLSHINTLTVFRGSISPQQQKNLQVERFCALANTFPLTDALAQVLAQIPSPGASEHQTGWAVDIRLCDGWDQLPRSQLLSASPEGQWLLNNCWRFGFIHRYPESAPHSDPACGSYHFRYVGKAHAAMMHALGLTLEDYLTLLHTQPVLTLWDDAGNPCCTVLCKRAALDLILQAPDGALLDDASLDHLGWGIAAYLWPAD